MMRSVLTTARVQMTKMKMMSTRKKMTMVSEVMASKMGSVKMRMKKVR